MRVFSVEEMGIDGLVQKEKHTIFMQDGVPK